MLLKPENGIAKFFQIIKEAEDQQPHIYDILYPKEEVQEEEDGGEVQSQNQAQAASAEKCPTEKSGDPDWDAEVTEKQLAAVSV